MNSLQKVRSLIALMLLVVFISNLSLADNAGLEVDSERFLPDVALANLATVDSALNSFRELTDVWRSENDFEIDSLPFVDWESQNLLFPNLVISLEGTILLQQMRIAELELAMDKQRGLTGAQVQLAEMRFLRAKEAFNIFFDNATISD